MSRTDPRRLAALLVSLSLGCSGSPFPAAGQTGKTFPKQVLIIRHAEKPEGKTSPHLSKRGLERAGALHELFESSAKRKHPFARPDFLFATHNTIASKRPRETVAPLAKKLGLKLNHEFRNHMMKLTKEEAKAKGKGIADLAREILGNKRYAGKVVLICWHHGTIPELAKSLGATGSPEKWRGKKVYDRVWQITYDDKGKATFADLPQRLLPGDARK
jgi:broad specificity phosphatase PhoE